jgi:hypothetical protein
LECEAQSNMKMTLLFVRILVELNHFTYEDSDIMSLRIRAGSKHVCVRYPPNAIMTPSNNKKMNK